MVADDTNNMDSLKASEHAPHKVPENSRTIYHHLSEEGGVDEVGLPREDHLSLDDVSQQVDPQILDRVVGSLDVDQVDELVAIAADPLLAHRSVVGLRLLGELPVAEDGHSGLCCLPSCVVVWWCHRG